jgi:hypothetical protein
LPSGLPSGWSTPAICGSSAGFVVPVR